MDSLPSSSSSPSSSLSPLVPSVLRRQYRLYREQCGDGSGGRSARPLRFIPSMLEGLDPATGSRGLFARSGGESQASAPIESTASTPPPPSPPPTSDTSSMETDEERKVRQRVEHLAAKLFRNSPMIRFMTRHLQLVGCDPYHRVDLRANPQAVPRLAIQSCPQRSAGGFTPSEEGQPYNNAGIVICANHIMDKQHLEQTLAHEMIHWWDHCRFRVNWDDLRQHACSEIRAASLSGDCKFIMEANRFPARMLNVVKRHQQCVRRRAVLSLVESGTCPDNNKAESVVDEVFENCFKDTRPFDEIY